MTVSIRLRPLVIAGVAAGTADLILGLASARLWAGEALTRAFARLGFEPTVTMGMVLSHTAQRVVMGACVAWLYVVMRPRFGGRRSAVLAAGFTAWFLMVVQFAWVNLGWGLFTAGVMVPFMAWGLVEMLLVAVVGAWSYERLGGA